MSSTMLELARMAHGGDDIFSFVVAVDDLGAPILSPAAPDICENDLPPDTQVAIRSQGGRFLVCVSLSYAEKYGALLERRSARQFHLTAAAELMKGRGLTKGQARWLHLAKQRGDR